jgi:hypothetical protein
MMAFNFTNSTLAVNSSELTLFLQTLPLAMAKGSLMMLWQESHWATHGTTTTGPGSPPSSLGAIGSSGKKHFTKPLLLLVTHLPHPCRTPLAAGLLIPVTHGSGSMTPSAMLSITKLTMIGKHTPLPAPEAPILLTPPTRLQVDVGCLIDRSQYLVCEGNMLTLLLLVCHSSSLESTYYSYANLFVEFLHGYWTNHG